MNLMKKIVRSNSKWGYQKKTFQERFWEKVDKNGPTLDAELGPCWIWTAFKDPDGYGRFSMDAKGIRKCNNAARVSWELTFGFIEKNKDIVVMHKCDNPSCVNHSHLRLGSVTENNRDRALKKRNSDQNGIKNNMSKLDDEAVFVIRYLYKNTHLSHNQISEIFKVSRTAISLILENKRWINNK